MDHLSCGMDEGYFDKKIVSDLKEKTVRAIKLVNGYIGYLNKTKASQVKEPEVDYTINQSTNNEINE